MDNAQNIHTTSGKNNPMRRFIKHIPQQPINEAKKKKSLSAYSMFIKSSWRYEV